VHNTLKCISRVNENHSTEVWITNVQTFDIIIYRTDSVATKEILGMIYTTSFSWQVNPWQVYLLVCTLYEWTLDFLSLTSLYKFRFCNFLVILVFLVKPYTWARFRGLTSVSLSKTRTPAFQQGDLSRKTCLFYNYMYCVLHFTAPCYNWPIH
jgi:hypothetical protein